MANLTNVYIRYEDRQLILHNPTNEDIDIDIINNQLLYTSDRFKDAVITEDQLFIEVAMSGIFFAIEGTQLVFYNVDDEDIDFTLEGTELLFESDSFYSDASIRSSQVFVDYGIMINPNTISQELRTAIHDAYKQPQRKMSGYTQIVYYNPLLDTTSNCTATSEGSGSSLSDVFKDNVSGWISASVSDINGYIDETLTLNFSARILADLNIRFNETTGTTATLFTLTLTNGTDTLVQTVTNINDTIVTVVLSEAIVDATQCQIHIQRLNDSGQPVKIEFVDLLSEIGYDAGDLMGIDLLEELSYTDSDAQLGAISANEITVYLNNETGAFNFNNVGSRVAKQLLKHRKIIPQAGIVALTPGTSKYDLYWIPLGVFWAYSWTVPKDDPVVTVVGFDTLGLLNKIKYREHYILKNVTLAAALTTILTAAQAYIEGLTFEIDTAISADTTVIPVVPLGDVYFFEALKSLSAYYPMDIYCDRGLNIVCKAQDSTLSVLPIDWSDSDIIVETNYPTLYSTVYNKVTVNLYEATYSADQTLVQTQAAFTINGETTRTFLFSNNCTNTLADPITISITKDAGVTVSKTEWFEWGCEITFTGTGSVSTITITGDTVSLASNSFVQYKDEDSIAENGENELTVDSQFIQNFTYADTLASSLLNKLRLTRYNAEVPNRGDFLATLNCPLSLTDSITDNKNYKIKQQDIKWDGTLEGTTKLYSTE